MKTTPRISISVRRGFACAGRRAMRIRPVRCSGRRGTTHAIPLKASSCTRRHLTSFGRPNDGFRTSVAPAVFDQRSHAGSPVNQQTAHDDDVAAALALDLRLSQADHLTLLLARLHSPKGRLETHLWP